MKQKSARRKLRSISTVSRHFRHYVPIPHTETGCSHSDIHQTKLKVTSEVVLNIQNTLGNERWRHTLQWWVQGSPHNSRRALLERFSIVRFKSINYSSLLDIIIQQNKVKGREGRKITEKWFSPYLTYLHSLSQNPPSRGLTWGTVARRTPHFRDAVINTQLPPLVCCERDRLPSECSRFWIVHTLSTGRT